MAIKTDYQDFVLKEGRNREFDIVQNANLSTSLIERDDAYETIGDYTGAGVLNELGTRAMYLFTQTVSGSIVSFDTEDMIKENTTINGSVLIETAIPSGATFEVNGITVPAYMGDDLVSELPVGKWATFIYDGTQLNFKGGSGGGLNFAVITVASEEDLPPTAKENTIGVITTTPMPAPPAARWGIGSPIARSVSTGGIWLDITTMSNDNLFDIMKGANKVALAPANVYQNMAGTWTERTAYLFDGTAWNLIKSRKYLYQNGEQYTDVTGGWVVSAQSGGGDPVEWNVNLNGSMYLGCKFGNSWGTVTSEQPVDMTPYSTLNFVGSFDNNTGNYPTSYFGASDSYSVRNSYIANTSINRVADSRTISINIASITGAHYVRFDTSWYSDFRISQIYME